MGLRAHKLILITAVLGLASAATAAETNPTTAGATKPADRPQVSSPYWNTPQTAASTFTGADQMLMQTVQEVPKAKADAVVAKWTYRRLDHELTRTSNNLRSDFRASPEYSSAVAELQAAYDNYETARQNAVRSVQNTVDYQAVSELRKNVGDQIADEHAEHKPDLDRLVALAMLKVDYISPIRAVEREAIRNSAEVGRARDRLTSAARAVAKLEKDFAHDVRDSIELSDIRKAREDARIAMLASAAYLQESRFARAIAFRYAFNARRFDRYIPRLAGYPVGFGGYGHGPYGSGGFGFGYGGRALPFVGAVID